MINKFDICKHFKGTSLLEKNIYGIMEIKMTYTGENTKFPDIVLYKPLFFNGICFIKEFLYLSGKIQYDESIDLDSFNKVPCFIREYDDLVKELDEEKQELYHQLRRVEVLTHDELNLILTEKFIQDKLNIENSVKKNK